MKTIAIVDDDIAIGNLLTELLEKEGYRVIRAYEFNLSLRAPSNDAASATSHIITALSTDGENPANHA